VGKQTERQISMLIATPRTPPGGEIITIEWCNVSNYGEKNGN